MKKIILVLLFTGFCLAVFPQQKEATTGLRNVQTIYWYGLDFSMARMLGIFNDKPKIQNTFLDAWNTTMVSGKVKGGEDFDLARILRVRQVVPDMKPVSKNNLNTTVAELFGNTDNPQAAITKEAIGKIVDHYTLGETEGTGMVLVVDSFDQSIETATVWVTYFNLSDKKIILTRKVTGHADGMGMTKHWVIAILDILKKAGPTQIN